MVAMESLWFPLLLLALVLIIFLRKPQNRKVPPGPPKLPIIGNLHQFGDLPHRSLWDLSTKYGPIMSFKIGSLFTFVVSSAETAKDVLKSHDLQTCSKHKFVNTKKLSYNFLDIAFSPYSDYWRDVKKLAILEVFSIKRVQSFRFIRENEVALLLDAISQAASSSNPVNLTYQMFGYSASILFRIALGYSFHGSDLDKGSFYCLFHDISTLLGEVNAEDYIPYIGWIVDRINGHHAKLERVFHEMNSIFENAINIHLDPKKNNQQSKDIIDVMLELDVDNQGRSAEPFVQRNHIKGLLMSDENRTR
ncbi:cytochrome P450 71B34-like isoform X2 [Carica papaya]|uniref:cytochrome P450 71B34-like isoform X2 n=1 Tax=Carica papaya TaxID=3649 RepID=UPI000B8CEFA6|nr:cytochrome P450 71B34-like isoform X2 [Carica papaya]